MHCIWAYTHIVYTHESMGIGYSQGGGRDQCILCMWWKGDFLERDRERERMIAIQGRGLVGVYGRKLAHTQQSEYLHCPF